jgi:hypothetical protein
MSRKFRVTRPQFEALVSSSLAATCLVLLPQILMI